MLTARRPDPALTDLCRRHGLVPVRISSTPGGAGTREDAGWIDVRLADDAPPAGMRCRLRRLPWYIPAAAGTGHPAAAPPLAHPDPAGPLPAGR